jgi:O-antigen/teichoic acid export membrane protein
MPGNLQNRITLNAMSSAVQVIIVGLVYFFLYRMLVRVLGIELLGVWSLIIAASTIAGIANFGIQPAIIKYVAEFNASGDQVRINKLLFTAVLALILIFVSTASLVYIIAVFFLDNLMELKYVKLSLVLIPVMYIGLLLNTIGSTLASALEGFQKNYIRNIFTAIISVCYFLIALIVVPDYGLFGLAIAQLIQATAFLIVSYYFVKRSCPDLKIFRWNWDRIVFKMLFSFGSKMQIVSICQMLTDPLTKILLSRFHGISVLGFFEMASKFVTQLRQVIAGITQVTLPVVSHLSMTNKPAIKYIYEKSLSFVILSAFPMFAGIILFSPFLSSIWIGKTDPTFLNCTYILSLGMLINLLCVPAYFNSLGEGKLNGILIMSIITVSFNFIGGTVFGMLIPVFGVVIANGLSYAIGSIFLVLYYHKKNNFRFLKTLSSFDYLIITISLLFAFIALFVFNRPGFQKDYNLKSFIYQLFIYAVVFTPLAYYNKHFRLSTILNAFKR